MNKFSQLFASPAEKFICVLGNSYTENFLANGTLSTGFAVLSDKRVYFKGVCFSRDGGGGWAKTQEERIVDIKDVTGTGFIHGKSLSLLLCAIFFSILPFVLLIIFAL